MLKDLAKGSEWDKQIAILNLPGVNLCEKRLEKVFVNGKLEQTCKNCVTQDIKLVRRMKIKEIKSIIDYFAQNYNTKIITINGRGDPFHPLLKSETLEKIVCAYNRWGIKSYIFTAGNNLDDNVCKTLANCGANVIISLYGNKFIDASFFSGKKYESAKFPLQNQKKTAENLRRLIRTYKDSSKLIVKNATRIGMNYVVSENDIKDKGKKLSALKKAANKAGLFFICNVNFMPNKNTKLLKRMKTMALKYSNFHLHHSTEINGQCQMGAGSSATVDFDGAILRCPYMDNKENDGNILKLSDKEIRKILERYTKNREYICVVRRTKRAN